MSDMTPFEESLHRDTTLVFQAPLGAGISVTLVTEDGSTHELRAMFATPGAELLSGVASAPVVSVAPHPARAPARCAGGAGASPLHPGPRHRARPYPTVS